MRSPVPDPPPKLDRLLVDHDPHVVDLTLRCREAILDAMPDATERVYLGWHGLGFHDPAAGYVCAIFPDADHVRVGFEHGHLLSDGRLEGTGKRVRYLVVPTWTDETARTITRLVVEALHVR